MGVLKKPASKLQGILKKPAASLDLALVPYQAAQKEPEDEEAEQDDLQEEDEEEVQEQPQEEEEEGDEAVQDHNLFLKEAQEFLEEDFDHFFKKLDEKQKQCLQANPGAEQAFKDGAGTGSGQAKDLSEEDFDHFFKKLDEKQKQCLWKKFETSRQATSKPSRTALAQAQARLPGRGACSGGGSSMVESRPSSSTSPPLSSAAPGLQASKLPG
eukprot:s3106_g16.t1